MDAFTETFSLVVSAGSKLEPALIFRTIAFARARVVAIIFLWMAFQ
jgi:hypothetical protein